VDLDAFDHRILRVLRVDGRISNAALAAEVGLSQSACLRRLRALEAGGVIRGYAALIDDPTEALPTVVVIQITLERQTEDHLNRFEAAVRRCPEVRECYLMGGEADYLLRVETDGTAGYERIHKEVLSRLPGVARIRSSFAIRTIVRGRGPA
jgi:DNA-binding Lrp family transcriptional regulator